MSGRKNPFQYEAAKKLPPEILLDVYIEDYNYTRFIQSTRNIFLKGDRGSGKSMTLLYNSFEFRKLDAKRRSKNLSLEFIGIYVPCNTPLTHKKESKLLDNYQAAILSEHYFVLSIIISIAETLLHVKDVIGDFDDSEIRTDYEYILGDSLPQNKDFFSALKLYAQAQLSQTQQVMNRIGTDLFQEKSFTFASSVIPLLSCIRNIPKLSMSHFLIMIDDAHELNNYQQLALNSWIAYRDHALYSFKVATAEVSEIHFRTASGGSILESHDYIKIDMEGDLQNEFSRFGKLAKEIIQVRLNKFGIKTTSEDFFLTNKKFLEDIEKCKEKVKKTVIEKNPNATPKQIHDAIYKYARAEYFRNRSPRANRPAYSGYETIVHLSTGIIRNLLEPCYWMYDSVHSKEKDAKKITEIPPSIQRDEILKLSKNLWKTLDDGLDNIVFNCSNEQAIKIKNLFEKLSVLFKERLRHHISEPRAIVFTISAKTKKFDSHLKPLLVIARKAQLLYTRISVAKQAGMQELYYVPNRMLWPIIGLDPVGQHARVSLKENVLINASNGINIPFTPADDIGDSEFIQEELFI